MAAGATITRKSRTFGTRKATRRGQSNNGNVYFDGPALYSYGSHFLTGYIMPDGVALLNGDSYSVSTSGHQSDARSAVSNRATFTIADLTELGPLLSRYHAGNSRPRRPQGGSSPANPEARGSAGRVAPL
jgi:hypothetical protein